MHNNLSTYVNRVLMVIRESGAETQIRVNTVVRVVVIEQWQRFAEAWCRTMCGLCSLLSV